VHLSGAFQHLDGKDRRQMRGDFGPGAALVCAGENRAGIGAEVDTGGISAIAGHRLPKHGEVAVFLRKTGAKRLPGFTGIA